MSKRNSVVIAGVALIGILLLINGMVIRPLRRIHVLRRVLPQQQQKTAALLTLAAEYESLKTRENRIGRTADSGVDAAQWLKEVAGRSNIAMDISEHSSGSCRISARGDSLAAMLAFLYALESETAPVIIKSITLTNDRPLRCVAELGIIGGG